MDRIIIEEFAKGNWGHKGRPGAVGGSGSGSGYINDIDELRKRMSDVGIGKFINGEGDIPLEELVEVGNAVLQEQTRIFNMLDSTKKLRITPVTVNAEKREDNPSQKGNKPSTAAYYMSNTITIYVDKEIFSVPISKDGKLNIGSAFTVDSSLKGVYRHEYGHHIGDNLRIPVFPFKELHRKQSSGSVSKYGNTNSDEFFAESFAARTHIEYGKSSSLKLPLHIEQAFSKIIKDN